MKKLLLSVAVIVATSFAANAQLWIGGSVSFGSTNGNDETVINTTSGSSSTSTTTTSLDPKESAFSFAPTVGYMFNDNMGAGLRLSYYMGTQKQEYDGNDDYDKLTTSGFTVAPFFRYVILSEGIFSVFGDLRVSYSNFTDKNEGQQTTGGTTITYNTDGPKVTAFGVGVYPGVQVKLTEKLSFESHLNIISLGYNSTKQTYEDVDELGGITTTTTSTSTDKDFGIGVNSNTAVSVGLVFKM